ncbi:MAG: nitrous oxide reductase family maturation protein NosD [Candidatus Bathyarchaeia archaeon]
MLKNSKILFLTLILSLIAGSLTTLLVTPAEAENTKTITVPTDFFSIKAAVGNASQGDIIIVKGGVYYENLVIDKALTLEGQGAVVDGGGVGTVVFVNADNVTFSGFTVQNSGGNLTDSGIYVNSSESTMLSGNVVTDNNIGVYLADSPRSLLRDNALTGNKFNFGVYSSNFDGYIQEIDQSNTVDGKPIVYWVNTEGKQAPPNAGYVAAVNCTDITVSDVLLEKNWQNLLFAYVTNSKITGVTGTLGMDGIWLIETSNCNLQNNNISGNVWGGVALVNTKDSTIQENSFKNNGGYGLFLSDSSSNQFFHNNFIDNPHQAWLYGENSNSWDNGYPSGGNYWSNYTGVDQYSGRYQNATGSDGLGDTPVDLAKDNVDNYPLTKPWTMQPNEPNLIPIEFSVTAIIAVTTILVIFIVYYVKKWVTKKQVTKMET